MVDKGKGIADDSSSAKRKRDGDEKSGNRKRKNLNVLQFFEDSAFESEESDSSDEDDFINEVLLEDDFGPDLEVKAEPKTPNLPFFPKEEDMDEEELEKVLEARYQPGANFVKYAEDRPEAATRSDERNTSMPFVMDPTIWKVKCMVGRERHSVFCLMQKYVDLQSLGTKLQLLSAFAVEHIKGFIYIEAEKQCDINEACKGLCNIYPSRVASVPMSDYPHLFSVRSKYSGVSVNTWARVKSGKYKGDLAQVVHVDEAKRKATVKLVPRIDLQAVAEKFGGGVTAKKSATPAPRLIASSELEAYRPLVQYRRDRDTGDMYEVFDGMTLKDGYLFKKVPLDSLSFWDVRPTEAELIKFTPARKEESNDVEWLTGLFGEHKKKKQTIKNDKVGGKGEGSSSSNMEDGFEVPDLVFHGRKAFGIVIGREKDDRIKVLEEGSTRPVVVAVEARLLKKADFDKKFNALDKHKKIISTNDTLRVLEGELEDKKGIVKQIYKGVVFLHDENETDNCGYFCAKAQICEKMEFPGDLLKGKGGKSDASGFGDFPTSPKSPLSPQKPWEGRENSRNFDREEKDGFSVGQSLRIRVGPLKGYMCRVMAIRYSDITVKLDSQHKILTVKAEHLAEVRGKTSAATTGDGQDSAKPFELLGDPGSSQGWMDGGAATETGGWNTGGTSTERSSWAPFPAAGSSLQPESGSANPFNTGDNEANKDAGGSAWDTKSTQDQGSAWGAAASEKKDGGWGASSSGVKNDDAGTGWGGAKVKDTSSDTSGWGNASATQADENKSAWNSAAAPATQTGGWGAVKKDTEDSKGWGKPDAAPSTDGGSWGKQSGGSSWGADQKKDDSGAGGGWGKAPSATGGESGSWGSADKKTEVATGWGSNKEGGSSWSKPDQDGGGSSWGSKPAGGGGSSWSSQDGGSSWGKQEGGRGGGGGGRGGGRSSGGNACFKCGESGHMSRECPQGGSSGGNNCFKCGESGHMSRECPKGGGNACFKCGESGHMSRECPQGGGGGGGGSRSCYKCGESGHMSRECPQGGGGGGGGGGGDRSCYKCGESGHMSRECPQGGGGGGGGGGRSCYKCGESGHMSRECPQGGGGGGGGGGDRSCYKCGESGHMSRECPQGGGGGGGKSCFKCGESGHMSRECPQGGGGGGGGGKSCFKCGESGHMSRECPQGGGGGGGGPKSCFKCGESGHMSRECPQGGGGGGGGGRSCYKCGESGHMARDCTQGGGGGGGGRGGGYGGGGWSSGGGGGGWGSDKKESGQSSGWSSGNQTGGGGGGWGSDKKEDGQSAGGWSSGNQTGGGGGGGGGWGSEKKDDGQSSGWGGGNQTAAGGGGGWGSSKASDDGGKGGGDENGGSSSGGGGGGWGASKGGGSSWGGGSGGGDEGAGGKKGGWGS